MEKKIQRTKKIKRISKIIFLSLVNIAVIPACILAGYPLGYVDYIIAILFQLALICLNYCLFHTRWRMCMADVISLCFTVAGMWGSCLLYQSNISNDDAGIMVFQAFLLILLVVSAVAVLLAMLSFYWGRSRGSEDIGRRLSREEKRI